jgi:hypothetical protein
MWAAGAPGTKKAAGASRCGFGLIQYYESDSRQRSPTPCAGDSHCNFQHWLFAAALHHANIICIQSGTGKSQIEKLSGGR